MFLAEGAWTQCTVQALPTTSLQLWRTVSAIEMELGDALEAPSSLLQVRCMTSLPTQHYHHCASDWDLDMRDCYIIYCYIDIWYLGSEEHSPAIWLGVSIPFIIHPPHLKSSRSICLRLLHRADFISGVNLRTQYASQLAAHLRYRAFDSLMRCKAVVETLITLGLTPHLHSDDENARHLFAYIKCSTSWATGEIFIWSAWEDSNLQHSDSNSLSCW